MGLNYATWADCLICCGNVILNTDIYLEITDKKMANRYSRNGSVLSQKAMSSNLSTVKLPVSSAWPIPLTPFLQRLRGWLHSDPNFLSMNRKDLHSAACMWLTMAFFILKQRLRLDNLLKPMWANVWNCQVLQFLPTSQKHAGVCTGKSKFALGVNMDMYDGLWWTGGPYIPFSCPCSYSQDPPLS